MNTTLRFLHETPTPEEITWLHASFRSVLARLPRRLPPSPFPPGNPRQSAPTPTLHRARDHFLVVQRTRCHAHFPTAACPTVNGGVNDRASPRPGRQGRSSPQARVRTGRDTRSRSTVHRSTVLRSNRRNTPLRHCANRHCDACRGGRHRGGGRCARGHRPEFRPPAPPQ